MWIEYIMTKNHLQTLFLFVSNKRIWYILSMEKWYNKQKLKNSHTSTWKYQSLTTNAKFTIFYIVQQ